MLVLGATVLACWIAVAGYTSYRSDQGLRLELNQLQAQTSALSSQVQAQRLEVSAASSTAWQAELARSQGLAAAGEQTYAIESAAVAAGPGPVEQGVEQVGTAVQQVAQGLVALG